MTAYPSIWPAFSTLTLHVSVYCGLRSEQNFRIYPRAMHISRTLPIVAADAVGE
ncbi:hypothetical protein BDU57DRAFT_525070 [Ampelomyces quisqualis]|uniref:Uncharacterized protein n=1 Tax=Ampelomyces quisqualis TaxID=50730 RepID=A0A6A5Q7V2_AMPQU|nr:hypothetical protein BDU57DRAFT_525070 [Ampelomyces quisqualis]